jgi:hypothetical protein
MKKQRRAKRQRKMQDRQQANEEDRNFMTFSPNAKGEKIPLS